MANDTAWVSDRCFIKAKAWITANGIDSVEVSIERVKPNAISEVNAPGCGGISKIMFTPSRIGFKPNSAPKVAIGPYRVKE